MNDIYRILIFCLLFTSCKSDSKSDAYGNFEATSIIVSSKGNGELLKFNIVEGKILGKNDTVGIIDTLHLYLEKLQLKANIEALKGRQQEAAPEVAVLLKNRSNLIRERNRTQRLFQQKAATEKELDDYNG